MFHFFLFQSKTYSRLTKEISCTSRPSQQQPAHNLLAQICEFYTSSPHSLPSYFSSIKNSCPQICLCSYNKNKLSKQIVLAYINNMIIEDYYGFNRNRNQSGSMPGGRSSGRTQRSAHGLHNRKSPISRTLKRTELSNEKIYSRDSKKAKKMQQPHLARQETSREPQSLAAKNLNQQEYSQPQPYPNDHLNTDSYQFRDSEQQRQFHNPFSSSRRGIVGTRGYEQTPNRPHHQINPRNYRSASKDRNQSFLFNFEREPQPIERYLQQTTPHNDIRAKKSRSLGRLKPYKMHTYYHAEKMNYYHYQEDGYITQRQEQLLMKIQERALIAFQRAAADSSVKSRRQVQNKQKPKKQFQIQESSKIQHRNSGILSDLKRQSSYRGTPRSSQRQLSKQHKKKSQKVLQLSINPKRTVQKDPKYDDYQISIVSRNKNNQQPSKKAEEQPKKDIFKNFAKDDSDDSSSLLQFKPKPKAKQQVKPAPLQQEQSVKRSSQISNDYKSVDMMQINSNYKPNKLEIKERLDFITDQNRSLGMDTIRSNKPKIMEPQPEKQKQSRNFSDSSSESQSQQFSELSSESKSKDHSQPSKLESSMKIDISKNKPKKSMSLSEPYSISSQNENVKRVQKKISGKQIDFKKKVNPLTQSDRFLSSRESIDPANSSNTSLKKPIKRLSKKANKPLQVQEHKFEDDLDVLGMQSYNNADTFPIQVRPNDKKNSKISELSSRNEVQQSFNTINKSKDKLASVSAQDQSPSLRGVPSIRKQPSSHSRSQPSIAYRSKHRLSSQVNSNAQYEIFLEIRDFLEMEEYEYNQTRRAKQVQNLISQELQGVIDKIENHLYIITLMAQIVLLIPEIYDFQIIYNRNDNWILFQVFLTLKKILFERARVVQALKGGKNCFKLLNYIIQDELLKKYLPRVEIQNILSDLQQCNFKLQEIINHFYSFLIKFDQKQFGNNLLVNLKPFRMNEDLEILLSEYNQEVQLVLKKKEEQFKGGNISPEEQQDFQLMLNLNERAFRLMQISFILSNLAGRQIKAYEKDEELYKQQSKFKNYLFENFDQFKEIPKYFK